jgi:hypothetical protein
MNGRNLMVWNKVKLVIADEAVVVVKVDMQVHHR